MDRLIRKIFSDGVEKEKYNEIDEGIENKTIRIIKQEEENLSGKSMSNIEIIYIRLQLFEKRANLLMIFSM